MIKDKTKYPVDHIFEMINVDESWTKKPRRINLDGDYIRVNSLRLQTFKLKGVECVRCGIKGKYFRKDKMRGAKFFHLNLYALKNGHEVLMTKDHIYPKSKGGKNYYDNLQVMCTKCNLEKGNIIEGEQ